MGNISDSAGIFTGATLDAFNAMEALVARDGEVAAASERMRQACIQVITQRTTLIPGSTEASTTVRRLNQP